MKLYFVRHGQTDANVTTASGQSVLELDEPLNETGAKQATELAKELRSVVFDVIISSPLKRAYQTADAINKYHKLEIITDIAWRERQAETYIEASTWHKLFDFDKNTEIGDVESLEDFFDRIERAIETLRHNYQNKTILVVSHGGVQHVLHAYAHDLPRTGNMRISPMKNGECRVYDL